MLIGTMLVVWQAISGCKNMPSAQQKRHCQQWTASKKLETTQPKMSILPVRSHDQAVRRKGEGCGAVDSAGEPETDVHLLKDLQVSDNKTKEVCKET